MIKRLVWAILACASAPILNPASAADKPVATITLPSADVPFSANASPQAKAMFAHMLAHPDSDWTKRPVAEARAHYDAINSDRVRRMREMFAVTVRHDRIGGVPVEIVTPRDGVPARNGRRVLINVHGGAFLWGAGSGGEVEAIPVSAVGGFEVVTVDYRMAPEAHFPAASEDIAAVYGALLKTHRPKAVGIYGCSAGGILTAEQIAWLATKQLPLPGAIGTFCGSLALPDGDSNYVAPALSGGTVPDGPRSMTLRGYFAGADSKDPLVLPSNSLAIVASFPPTLLITGSRDQAMSGVLQSHRLLVNAGVDAELHVWDGMWHSFFSDPELPESQEAYRVIAAFFDKKLTR
jgi:acetyl esterase/lipase